MSKIKIISELSELRAQVAQWRSKGKTVGFVPTMGALHDGHLSLVDISNSKADKTIASIFVNPAQFAPGEDYDSYPRAEEADIAMLEERGAHVVYLPSRATMYAEDHSVDISVGGPSMGLETNHRPTFFDGVSLVVTKLLNRVQPDVAVFGEKDYQQLATIRRLVRDLDMPVEIIGAPIARDAHGLALSSRNRYFDEDGLTLARKVNEIMFACRDALRDGATVKNATEEAIAKYLDVGMERVDYVSVTHAESLELQTLGRVELPARLLVALHCEGVRLIDNCEV